MISIGIDLGGTNIAVGVVEETGHIIGRAVRPTGAQRPCEQVIFDMAQTVRDAVENAGKDVRDIHSIGCGVPGIYDEESGMVLFCTNLGWRDVPLRSEMAKYFNAPFYCDNDATVAALAEAKAGKSVNVRSSVLLTLGTGIGAGIVLDGKVFSGSHGVAGEFGHFMYCAGGELCTCGKRGCFERYASATALIRIGCEAALRHRESVLRDLTPNQMNARAVVDAAHAGDAAGVEAFDEYTTHLSNGIVTVIDFLDPEMILLGGGVSAAGDFLLDPVRAKVERNKFYTSRPHAAIELAALGNDAGIIGAAMLGRQ